MLCSARHGRRGAGRAGGQGREHDGGGAGALEARCGGGARAGGPGGQPAGARAVARPVAAGAGLVGGGGGGGAGARSAHGRGLAARVRAGRPQDGRVRADGRVPPALTAGQQAALGAALDGSPRAAGVELSTWNWKAVRAYLATHFGVRLGKSGCLRYLHRLGFVRKRPKKRLTRADAAKRAAFVEAYLGLVAEAERTGATIFFVDEAHFRADGDLRAMWVRKGAPALVDSSSPRWGEKASYDSAVCLETGEVEAMELAGTSTAATSAAFLRHLRATHPGPLIVIWDNGPAHGGFQG